METNLNTVQARKKWSNEEVEWLEENYPIYGKKVCIDALGCKESQLRSKVSKIGLKVDRTNPLATERQRHPNKVSVWSGKKRPDHSLFMKKHCQWTGKKRSLEDRERISNRMKKFHKDNPSHNTIHKTGWTHPENAKRRMRELASERWKDPHSKLNSDDFRNDLSNRATMLHRLGILGRAENTYSKCKRGWFEVGGKKYFMRSKWEMNYASYLQWLVINGQISGWEYEADTFWFEGIKRGVRSYKPDFKVTQNNGTIEYHEIKGWMDKKSQTKIKRMRIYHPSVKLIIIDGDQYKEIKKMSRLFPGWID